MSAPLLPIDPAAEARRQEKLREAIAALGTRYLLHPANRVQRVTEKRVLR